MKELLSYKSIRALQIAEKLINTHDYIPFTEFQEINQCSNKTVYEDIYYLKEHWDEILDLDIIKNKARSHKTSIYDLMHMKRKMFHEEIKVKLIVSIFFNPYRDMIDHSLTLEYSDSHLRSQVKAANHYLETYNISIEYDRNKKGYYIQAENDTTLIIFISELIKVSENEHFLLNLTVQEQQKFDDFIETFNNFIPKLLLKELLNLTIIQKTVMTHKNLTIGEGKTRENVSSYMKHYAEIYDSYLEPYMLKHNLEIPQDQFRQLIDIFTITSLKLQAIPKRVDNFLNRYDYFYKAFSKENPKMISIFDKAMNDLFKKTNIDFEKYKTELLFYIYTHITSLRDYKRFNIGVYSDLGEAHIESIIMALKKNFNVHYFNSYSPTEKYNLVITTTDNQSRIDLNETPYIKIADYITHQDIYNVYQKIYLKNESTL